MAVRADEIPVPRGRSRAAALRGWLDRESVIGPLFVAPAMVLHGVTQLASNAWRAWIWRAAIRWDIVSSYALGALVAATAFTAVRFTLRPGARYSDGTPVRPEDFRASMERFLRVSRGEFGDYYGGIVGADRCMHRPARCDLSAGIETDASARTIAVHLTRPDEEFLHKLTLGSVCAILFAVTCWVAWSILPTSTAAEPSRPPAFFVLKPRPADEKPQPAKPAEPGSIDASARPIDSRSEPVSTTKPDDTPRCVTGIPASPGAAMARRRSFTNPAA